MLIVADRVRELREEIREIELAHRIHGHERGAIEAAKRQRRETRLKEIQEELSILLGKLKPEG